YFYYTGLELTDQKIIDLEIKAGETFNKDYLKNFKNFPSENDKITKTLIFTGDSSSSSAGVNIIGQDYFKKFLNTIS
ncbi:MAG: hypothetical protein JXP36_03645, partial [Bacteroidales bacterium]|nr:hypothetical protein [Bacteroidales bacterium]